MPESTDTSLSELLREKARLDDKLAQYQQLVTVLFVDIVGSTRFYEQHGDVAGLGMVQKFFDKLVPLIEQHEGVVVKTIGDAILARFPSALDGARCALNMQWALLEYNGGRAAMDQIHIRVALNAGFVLIKGTDVFGDVVNVCSRIESAAQPDDILMSPSVYDQICQNEEIAVRKRAEGVRLKGKTETLDLYEVVWRFGDPAGPSPPRPSESQVALAALPQAPETREVVAVPPTTIPARPSRVWSRPALLGAGLVIVLAVAAAFWAGRAGKSPAGTATGTGTSSIAVLPFVDLSPEKNQEYFSDGLAEELLNDLSKIPGLRVTARTSSFQFKGKSEDLRTVGQKLNVAAILEGSVRKDGNRVRITAQLIQTSDGFHLWSESYDRELNDIFAVQQEIAGAVAASLKLALFGGKTATPSPPSTNSEAYNAYLQGRYFYERRSKEDLEKATGYYERAIQLDPKFAPAWAGLAWSRAVRAGSGYVPADEGYRKTREAAEQALALDPNLAEAYAAIGFTQTVYDWDWAGADASYQRALALEPGNANILRQADVVPLALGRFDEALALDRRAVDLDPLNPSGAYSLAQTAFYAGRLDEAVAALNKVFELAPQRPQAHRLLGLIHLAQSHPQEALAEMEREQELLWRLHGQALAYHALGRKRDSDRALMELVGKFHTEAAFQIAEVYAYRGETENALEWLERAYAQRDGGLAEIRGDPLLRSLEREPRYAALMNKLHLPM